MPPDRPEDLMPAAAGRQGCGAGTLAETAAIRLRFAATRGEVRTALTRLAGWASAAGGGAGAGPLEIVMGEVLNNIVAHACNGRPGRIGLRVAVAGPCFHCRVTDDGSAMPAGTLPAGGWPRLDVPRAQLPEGGFGWSIIRGLVHDLRYRRHRGHNVLEFRVAADDRREA